jgi:hypothetical protein
MLRSTTLLIALPLTLALGCDARSPAEPPADAAVEAEALDASMSAQGLVRTAFPSAESPGGPMYARIVDRPPFAFSDGVWSAIWFYRDPDCVRPDFNLLLFFDVPFAFACPMTVHGFELWHGEPGVGAPHTVITHGSGAVPVWFVPEGVFLEAIQDGELTMGELASLPGLIVGHASQFEELLQPDPGPPEVGGGGHRVVKINVSALGTLEDGREFKVQVAGVRDRNVLNVQIRFW